MNTYIPESHYYSKEQAAASLGVSCRTVDRMIRDGHIPSVKIGRCVKIEPEAVRNFIKTKSKNRY